MPSGAQAAALTIDLRQNVARLYNVRRGDGAALGHAEHPRAAVLIEDDCYAC